MRFGARTRKAVLMVHVASSVGWIGAVGTFIALDLATVLSDTPATLRASYIAMDLMARQVIVPLALASLASGIAISLGTAWGLFRHYWVVLSLVLTALATAVLVAQLPHIAHRAALAADPATADVQVAGLGNMLLHSVGGTVVLLVVMALNVYKPRGVTRYGQRKARRGSEA